MFRRTNLRARRLRCGGQSVHQQLLLNSRQQLLLTVAQAFGPNLTNQDHQLHLPDLDLENFDLHLTNRRCRRIKTINAAVEKDHSTAQRSSTAAGRVCTLNLDLLNLSLEAPNFAKCIFYWNGVLSSWQRRFSSGGSISDRTLLGGQSVHREIVDRHFC